MKKSNFYKLLITSPCLRGGIKIEQGGITKATALHQKKQYEEMGLIVRIIPEKEIMLYAILKKFEFHNAECPYSVNASRRIYRDIIDNLEYNNPGTRHSILRSYDAINPLLIKKYPPANLSNCINCGEPTSQKKCKTCILKEKIL